MLYMNYYRQNVPVIHNKKMQTTFRISYVYIHCNCMHDVHIQMKIATTSLTCTLCRFEQLPHRFIFKNHLYVRHKQVKPFDRAVWHVTSNHRSMFTLLTVAARTCRCMLLLETSGEETEPLDKCDGE